MEASDAVTLVLRSATQPLHWTVIQDRALREGYVDPFVIRDVRGEILSALRTLVAAGEVDRVEQGVYRLRVAGDEGREGSSQP
jgi:hypothetical protein